jgi:hypothetical protein
MSACHIPTSLAFLYISATGGSTRTYRAAVLKLGSTEPQEADERFQRVHELGWEKNYNFILTNL